MSSRTTLVKFALTFLVLAGCAEEFRGREPLKDGFHFPIAMAVDSDNGLLYVVNTNFDLAYRHASVVSIDLDTNEFAEPFLALGSFPGDFILAKGEDGTYGYVAVRGDNSLTWFEVTGDAGGTKLICDGGSDTTAPCQGAYVVTEGELPAVAEDPPETVNVGADPFGLALLPGVADEPDRLLLAALANGVVTVLDIGAGGVPEISAQTRLLNGLHSAAVDPSTRLIYLTNRQYPVVYRLKVTGPSGAAELETVDTVGLPSPFATAQFGRGLAFSAQGRRVLIAYRTPSGLVVLDGADESPAVSQKVIGFVPLGNRPGQVRVFPTGPEGSELAYTMCYGEDTVWVVDPASLAPLERIEVGAGPYDMVAVAGPPARGYVSNFLGDSISVIDLDPASKTYHTQIAELE